MPEDWNVFAAGEIYSFFVRMSAVIFTPSIQPVLCNYHKNHFTFKINTVERNYEYMKCNILRGNSAV